MTDTLDMFPASAPATDEPEDPPFFLGDVAAAKSGVPGWRWFKSRVVGDDAFILEGGIPRIIKAGKNKGASTWKGQPTSEVVVTRAEVEAAKAAYEKTTGKCRECAGSKRVSYAWSKDKGRTYSTCRRCNGTGVPTP